MRPRVGHTSRQQDFRRICLSDTVEDGEVDAAFARASRNLRRAKLPIQHPLEEEWPSRFEVETPVSATSVKSWPDYLLACSGAALVIMVLVEQVFARPLSLPLLLCFAGAFLVGAAAKASICKIRRIGQRGEIWQDKWSFSPLTVFVAGMGVVIGASGVAITGLTLLL